MYFGIGLRSRVSVNEQSMVLRFANGEKCQNLQKSPLGIGINGAEGAYFGEIKGIFSKIVPFKDVLDLKIIEKGISNGEKCQNLQKSPLGGVRVNLSKCGVLWS